MQRRKLNRMKHCAAIEKPEGRSPKQESPRWALSPGLLLASCFSACCFCPSPLAFAADANWPQFRGPAAAGIGSGAPPAEWKVETEKNIRWKTAIPGLAHSSPVIWGD